MVDCLQVNSSRWAPSIDRSVKLNTWLCFLADSREIEEQVEPSHPPPPPPPSITDRILSTPGKNLPVIY